MKFFSLLQEAEGGGVRGALGGREGQGRDECLVPRGVRLCLNRLFNGSFGTICTECRPI